MGNFNNIPEPGIRLQPFRGKDQVLKGSDSLVVNAIPQHSGEICPGNLYTLKEFMSRLGIASSTLRAAKRAGLPVYYMHKRGYVLGKDWIKHVLNK